MIKSFIRIVVLFIFFLSLWTCSIPSKSGSDYRLVFGSCTDAYKDSLQLWKEMQDIKPDLVLILGDIVYTHTENIDSLQAAYTLQKSHTDYKNLSETVPVEAIYDDNDYGQNDGGKFNLYRQQAQKMVLNFLNTPASDPRHSRDGLYFSRLLSKNALLITLDTRTFRDDLTKSKIPGKRYDPNPYGQGSMLGEEQWKWLENQIADSKNNQIFIASTIQIVNNFHGYECWGNMPHERDRLFNLLKRYPEKRCILLSGDRHFSEISKIQIEGLPYPLYDITSSGITQVYSSTTPEPNSLRLSPFIREYNYTSILLKGKKTEILFLGAGNKILYQSILKI